MAQAPLEDGLRVVDTDVSEDEWSEDGRLPNEPADSDVESLRDEFVDAFNARDLDSLLTLLDEDVECPDITGDGREALAEELESIWERSPGAILTRAFLDGVPCAVAWLPDEDGCWSRASLVWFDCPDGVIGLVALPDDPDALERAEAEEPTGEEFDEWSDWSEWERGEETIPRTRNRDRP